MPYIFSDKQIIHAHFLLTEHGMNINELAQLFAIKITDCHNLVRLVCQTYKDHRPEQIEKPKEIPKQEVTGKKYCLDAKGTDLNATPAPFKRPKAEYSNQRLYDLI